MYLAQDSQAFIIFLKIHAKIVNTVSFIAGNQKFQNGKSFTEQSLTFSKIQQHTNVHKTCGITEYDNGS